MVVSMTIHPTISISQKSCSRRTLRVTVFVYLDDWLKPYQKLLPRTDS